MTYRNTEVNILEALDEAKKALNEEISVVGLQLKGF